MIRRRVDRLEAQRPTEKPVYVIYTEDDDEDPQVAIARSGVKHPVAVMPRPSKTVEEWIERFVQKGHQ